MGVDPARSLSVLVDDAIRWTPIGATSLGLPVEIKNHRGHRMDAEPLAVERVMSIDSVAKARRIDAIEGVIARKIIGVRCIDGGCDNGRNDLPPIFQEGTQAVRLAGLVKRND